MSYSVEFSGDLLKISTLREGVAQTSMSVPSGFSGTGVFSGEKIGVRVYREGIQNVTTSVSVSDPVKTVLSSASIGPEDIQLIPGSFIRRKNRRNKNERLVSIGSVVQASGTSLQIIKK